MKMAMLYRYDQLNRIKQARSLRNYDFLNGFEVRTADPEPYDADYNYDANGNLLALIRRNEEGLLNASYGYTYEPGTNKLIALAEDGVDWKDFETRPSDQEAGGVYQHISFGSTTIQPGDSLALTATQSIELTGGLLIEPGATFTAEVIPSAELDMPEGTFVYDEIGNLVADELKEIAIDWTVYGKVKAVTKSDGSSVTFNYDGAGNRVTKTFTAPDGTAQTTHYVRDASGNAMAIYRDDTLREQPIYGSARLGQYTGGNQPGKRIWTNKRYELTNHLGNVMAVISDRIIKINAGTTGGGSSPAGGPPSGDAPSPQAQPGVFAHVLTINDYYPFGLEMPGRSYNFNAYRYGFNGKEKDDKGEWGSTHYDYGFRIYNPQIGRFLSVDPLTKKYAMLTPYQFASNMPIWAIDLDGLESVVTIFQDIEDLGYQQTFRIFDDDETFATTINNLRKEYPDLPTSGAVNIILDKNGNYVGQQVIPDLIIEGAHFSDFRKGLNEVGRGFKEVGQTWDEFFTGDSKDAIVARKTIGGIVGAALAIPSGGGSFTLFGGFELGFSINSIASGINDAQSENSNSDSNLLRDLIRDEFGEETAKIYDGLELYTYTRGFAQNKKNIVILLDKLPSGKEKALGEFIRMANNAKEATKKLNYFLVDKKNADDEK